MAKQKEYKKTILGKIPIDWDLKEFVEVIDGFSSGQTPHRAVPEYYRGEIPWITSGELNYNLITDTIEKITDDGAKAANLKMIPKGTFLFAITGLEAAGTRGSCAITGIEATTNQSCMALYPKKGLLTTQYLYHYYVRYGNELAFKYCQGTKQQSYTGGIAKKLPIIVPSTIEEQTLIATALTDTDNLINSLEKLIFKKKLIKTGTIQKILTPSNVRNNKMHGYSIDISEWKTKTTKELCEKLWIGLVTTMTTNYVDIGTPLVRNSDIKENYFKTDLIQLENNFAKANSNRSIKTNDVITVHTGDVGTSAVAPSWLNGAHGFATINSRLNTKEILPKFYSYYLNSKHFKSQLIDVITGDGRSNLNLYDFIKLKVSYPPIQIQQKIIELLSEMDAEITALETKLEKYRKIKLGMMQNLLTGKIRLI